MLGCGISLIPLKFQKFILEISLDANIAKLTQVI